MKLTKAFKYSINGYIVKEFKAGEYDELHEDVVAHAKKIGALEEPKSKTKAAKKQSETKKAEDKKKEEQKGSQDKQ